MLPLLGDGGVDAVVGTTGGEDADVGDYFVSTVMLDIIKSQAIADQFGGTQAIPGATITYTVTIQVTTTGTATASVFSDLIPTFTTFVPTSITLNSLPLSDGIDADAGEYDNSGAPTVVVRLGDLILASGIQTVVFQVTID